MRVLAYCLMPNHFHLALWPHGNGDLSRWMQWLVTAHLRRYHRWYEWSGRPRDAPRGIAELLEVSPRSPVRSVGRDAATRDVWQGRFKAFPIEQDEHLLTVLRYIEQNPMRAKLVTRAEDWRWSSARHWVGSGSEPAIDIGPVARPSRWLTWINGEGANLQLEQIRVSVNRGCPFGSPVWVERTAATLGLEGSLRPPGRPRKSETA